MAILISVSVLACSNEDENSDKEESGGAHVTNVTAEQVSGGYNFSVTISSPDKGCEQYADWWEVVDREGKLLYRRILAHSHVNEQPFTRSGGPVPVSADMEVWVRAHMNNSGYGGDVFFGSPAGGFTVKEMPAGFAESLAEEEPLPGNCAF